MIFLQIGILFAEIALCLDINHLLKDKVNKKVLYVMDIILLLICFNMRSIQAMWAIHTLICLLLLQLLSKLIKKPKPVLCIILSMILSTGIVSYGYINMHTIHQTTYTIQTNKNINSTKICFISDVHYPNANNPKRLQQIINQLKKTKPDFYLLGGDFVDESTSTKDMKVLFNKLKQLTTVAPVYYVYGNHENKTKFSRKVLKETIQKDNIQILNDQKVQVRKNMILVGRQDYTNLNRKKTKDYYLSKKNFNIVLDHQPQGTKENINNHVNLQISGHTHNGQIMPLSISYHLQPDFAGNYGKTAKKQYTKIISSGLVGWGFPLRTEGICEYVVVNITPKK